MKIESIEAGKTYWIISRRRMGNTKMTTVDIESVKVAYIENNRVYTSRGMFLKSQLSNWRKNKPTLVQSGILGQYRLATREELKAIKEGGNV